MKRRHLTHLFSAIFALSIQSVVNAADYYVDPTIGSMSNPGSVTEPWSTLAAVFSAGKTFNAGDVIYLRSGDHGFPIIKTDNTGDVLITKEVGQNPVINRIDFDNATHWVLEDVKVNTTATPPIAPILVHPVPAIYENTLLRITNSSSYITVKGCEIYSIADPTSWVANDWNNKAWNGIYMHNSSHHLEIDGCEVRNINFAIHMSSSTHDIAIRNSIVENFCGDGLRANCDDLLIENNIIRDVITSNPGQHYDFIQGFASERVVIRGNVLINATSVRELRGDSQGIGAFDGWFDEWVIENNIIATGHWNSLTLLGARNCRIANNTVIKGPFSIAAMQPWIQIGANKNGTASSGNYCINNLVTSLNTMSGTTVSNNIVTTAYTNYFEDYGNLDFHLKSGSPAIDAGTETEAPMIDFEGDTRSIPYDVGADEFKVDEPDTAYGLDIVVGEADEVLIQTTQLGWLSVGQRPWTWSYSLANWAYLPLQINLAEDDGSWIYLRK